ncbi:MAG: hypothetical protein HFJ12_01240 [Bacilli bacterium]|nr:hypothetical protein [Bacilli bacterium]
MVFYENGRKIRYNPYNMKRGENKGSGQEVDVYKEKDEVVKFYKPYCGKIRMSKETCEYFQKIHTKRILLPKKVLLDKKRQIRGYKMPYIENLGANSLYLLNRDELKNEMNLIHEDIVCLSDYHVLIEDLSMENSVYHNGIYFVDPGSYQKCETIPTSVVYGMNMDLVNEYLLSKVFRRCCISVQKDYHKINAVMDLIEREIEVQNLTPLTYLMEKMESKNLLEYIEDKFRSVKSIGINRKKIYLVSDCSDSEVEVYNYKDQEVFKQIFLYKVPSLKLSKHQMDMIKGIPTQRILTPTDDIRIPRDYYEGFITIRKTDHEDELRNLSGEKLSLEFDYLIRDMEILAQHSVFMGNFTRQNIVYDKGIFINNIENFEFCRNSEEAIERNRISFNQFLESLIEEGFSCQKIQEIIDEITESSLDCVNESTYSELYKDTSLDYAKKLTIK